MLGRKFRSAIAAAVGVVLVSTVTQVVPASADTTVASPLHVMFGVQSTTPVSGYTVDYGQAYNATSGYGWVLASNTATPYSIVGNGRDRGAVVSNKLLDSFMMPQSLGRSGDPTVVNWKANVANGTYNVTIGAGDPSYTDSTNVVNVEGVNVINFVPTTATTQQVVTKQVTVTDGVLNVDENGGDNTKINYIDAVPVSSGTTTSTTTAPTTTSTTSTTVPATTTTSTTVPATTTTSTTVPSTTTTSTTVPSTTTTTTAPSSSTTLHYQFGTASTVAQSGYTLNYGQAYSATTGSGWVLASDNSTPYSIVGNGRDRGSLNTNKLLNTFMMPQSQPNSGDPTNVNFKAVIPNGTYNITVGSGDPSYTDSVDVVNVEGVKIVNFTPSATASQVVSTGQVTVTDGVLNVTEDGGNNTKIDYIDAVPVTSTPSSAPTVVVTPSGTTDTSGNYVTTATITIAASETGGSISSTKYTLDNGASTTYSAPFNVTGTGSHTIVATATDAKGVSTSATNTFTIAAASTTGTSYNYEFGVQTTSPINGYTLDYGNAFNGTYGWENASTGAALSYVGNGRDRGVNSNKLLDRFMMPQLVQSTSGNHTPGKWEAVVANGTYNVTIGVGDPSYTDSIDMFSAEGVQLVNFTPTTANPQTTATKTVTVTDGRITLDPTGGTNSKIDYISLVPSGGGTTPPADTTAPSVSAAVNGTTNATGSYLDSATVAVSATDASGVKSINYTLDGVAGVYTQPVVVSGVGSHTFVVTATDTAGNTSTGVTKTFTIVSSGTSVKPTSLAVASPQDNLGLGSRLVFSTVYGEPRASQNLTLTNKGSGTLTVSGLTITTANFVLCSGQATSFSIASGKTATVCVNYKDSMNAASMGTQVDQGTLTIKSNDATVPSYVVTLGGLDAENYESYHEPSLQQIFDSIGFTDNVAVNAKDQPQKNSISSANTAVGDEVLAPYFLSLDSSKPVNLVPLAHYSGKQGDDSNAFGYYYYGKSSSNLLYDFPGGNSGTNDGYGQNQLTLPTISGCSGCSGTTSFSPTSSFGIVVPYPGYTDHTDDALNSAGWHNIRVYPAKDANGNVIAGEYLLGDDVGAPTNNSAKNWDYQDFAFLLTNVKIDTTKKQPTEGVQAQTLSGFNGGQGGIAGTGFTSVQGALNTSLISTSNGNLLMKTSNDSNTSHTNALQIGVNAGDKFAVQSRLVGSFAAINQGNDQQGIYFGPDASDFVKAEVDYENGARHLTIWYEQNGNGTLTSIVLPNTSTGTNDATTVDLKISIDSSPQASAYYNGNPRVQVSYALNGGAFTNLGSVFNIPTWWITANTPAGLITSDDNGTKTGGPQFTATYNSFQVGRDF